MPRSPDQQHSQSPHKMDIDGSIRDDLNLDNPSETNLNPYLQSSITVGQNHDLFKVHEVKNSEKFEDEN